VNLRLVAETRFQGQSFEDVAGHILMIPL
jgi:hypothetical protein